jgi:hypothetical protein
MGDQAPIPFYPWCQAPARHPGGIRSIQRDAGRGQPTGKPGGGASRNRHGLSGVQSMMSKREWGEELGTVAASS